MSKSGAFLKIKIPKNLERDIHERIAQALRETAEEVLSVQKEVAPLAFANLSTRFGWPKSFQSSTRKPRGKRQGGQLARSITLEVDEAALRAEFSARTRYARYVHEGTLHFIGRPYLITPIREVGIPLLRESLHEKLKDDYI